MTYNLRTETVPIFYLALKNQIEPKFPLLALIKNQILQIRVFGKFVYLRSNFENSDSGARSEKSRVPISKNHV